MTDTTLSIKKFSSPDEESAFYKQLLTKRVLDPTEKFRRQLEVEFFRDINNRDAFNFCLEAGAHLHEWLLINEFVDPNSSFHPYKTAREFLEVSPELSKAANAQVAALGAMSLMHRLSKIGGVPLVTLLDTTISLLSVVERDFQDKNYD